MMMKISPSRISRSTRAHGADQACAAARSAALALPSRLLDEILGVRAEQLPDIAAGEFDGPGVVGTATCPDLSSTVHRVVLRRASTRDGPASSPEQGRCPVRAGPTRPRPSTWLRWQRSSRRRRLPADLPSRSTSPLILFSSSVSACSSWRPCRRPAICPSCRPRSTCRSRRTACRSHMAVGIAAPCSDRCSIRSVYSGNSTHSPLYLAGAQCGE